MNLNFVTGTAAELIKVYPLIQMSLERAYGVRVIMTGQSRENFMLQYRDFALPENILVSLLKSEGDLNRASSAMRWLVRAAVTSRRTFGDKLLPPPDDQKNYVVVHGDTLSTLLGTWLGYRASLPVVHIEAGLRSPRLLDPFPEEICRRLVSRMAQFHMSPDLRAQQNLQRAKVSGTILNTEGNTLKDTVWMSAKNSHLTKLAKPFVLTNLHRFENLNSSGRWQLMIDTVVQAAQKNHVVFVAHPQTLHKLSLDPTAEVHLKTAGVEIRPRMAFSEFIALLKSAEYLISDGGSNQEECSYLGKPCLLLRESTERQEGLGSCCVLSGFNRAKIDLFLHDPSRYSRTPSESQSSPSLKILDSLQSTGPLAGAKAVE